MVRNEEKHVPSLRSSQRLLLIHTLSQTCSSNVWHKTHRCTEEHADETRCQLTQETWLGDLHFGVWQLASRLASGGSWKGDRMPERMSKSD